MPPPPRRDLRPDLAAVAGVWPVLADPAFDADIEGVTVAELVVDIVLKGDRQ